MQIKKKARLCHVPDNLAELFYRLVRGILYAFTFILCIFGLSLILFSFWYLYEGESYHLDNWLKFCVFTFSLVIGIVLFTFATCGLIGVLNEKILLSKIFLIGMMLLMAVELVCIFYVYAYKKDIMNHANTLFEKFIVEYSEDDDVRSIVDTIQSDLKCCGISSPNDWEGNAYYNCNSISTLACSVPASCCYNFASNNEEKQGQYKLNMMCGVGIRKNESIAKQYQSIHVTGCKYSIYSFLDYKHKLTSTVLIGVVVPQLIGIILITCFIITLNYLIQYDLLVSSAVNQSRHQTLLEFERCNQSKSQSVIHSSSTTSEEDLSTTTEEIAGDLENKNYQVDEAECNVHNKVIIIVNQNSSIEE